MRVLTGAIRSTPSTSHKTDPQIAQIAQIETPSA
jgi:hypothetical protein